MPNARLHAIILVIESCPMCVQIQKETNPARLRKILSPRTTERCLEVPRGQRRWVGGLGDVSRATVAVGIAIGITVGVPVPVGISIAIGVSIGVAIRAVDGPALVSPEILRSVCRAITHSTLLCHVHLGLARLVVFRPDGGHEIDEEAEYVEEVYECNDPLEHCGDIVLRRFLRDAECNRERHLDEDEEELDPEAVPQDGMFAEVYPEPLVFPADENC